MIFAINLLLSMFLSHRLSYLYERSNIKSGFGPFFLFFSPIWIMWLLICGGQYEVGTDYASYYSIFEENTSFDYFFSKGEWLFALIVKSGQHIGVPAQGMFAVFYLMNFIFLYKLLYLLDKKIIFFFILLYISLSTVFNNQLNGLRQYTAIYIITYATVNYYNNKSYLKFLLWVTIATGIHLSSVLVIPFSVFFLIPTLKSHYYYFILAVSAFMSLTSSLGWTVDFLSSALPPFYSHYLQSDLNTSNDVSKVITKFIFFPFYLLSVRSIFSSSLSDFEKNLCKIGLFAYCLRLIFLENIIFNRVGQFFVLISVFPILMYIKLLVIEKKEKIFLLLFLMLIGFYFMKTVAFPSAEYSYKSIYFL